MISVCFQGKPFYIMVIQVYAPTSNAEEAEVEQFYEDLQDLLELTPKKGVLFIIGDWNARIGSQETTGVTGKFGLGVQNEAGEKIIECCQENALAIANILFQHTREDSTHGRHQLVNIEIRLIIFFPGIKIAKRNINNLIYADESEKVGLKLNIQKMKIMASGPITSWKVDAETVETMTDFIFRGLQNQCMW